MTEPSWVSDQYVPCTDPTCDGRDVHRLGSTHWHHRDGEWLARRADAAGRIPPTEYERGVDQ